MHSKKNDEFNIIFYELTDYWDKRVFDHNTPFFELATLFGMFR